jgi:sec-independent protein translocase protein TatA
VLSSIGIWGLLIIVFVAILAFAPRKIPQMTKSLGKGMREFKEGVTGNDEEDVAAPDGGRPPSAPSKKAEP